MPRKRTQKPKPKAPRRPKPPRAKKPRARALRPRGSHKRRMVDQLIAVENERGEPREIPRDVDIQGRYTVAALRRYVAGVEGILAGRERAKAEMEAETEAGDAGVGVWVGDGGRGQVLGRVQQGEVGRAERIGSSERVALSVRSLVEQHTQPSPEEQFTPREQPRQFTPEEPRPEPCLSPTLTSLPLELREQIYRPLLVSPTPIVVYNAWTTLHRRQPRRSLTPSILRTCRRFYAEGMRVLYGGNSFEYLVRNATAAEATPDGERALGQDVEEEGGEDSDGEYDDDAEPDVLLPEGTAQHDINIPRHGPLMRYLTIRAEANRSGQEYLRTAARAITVFTTLSPVRARVHTLRLEVQSAYNPESGDFSFADWFTPGTELMRALVRLPCRFVEFVIWMPGGREVRVGVNREYGAAVRRARRGVGSEVGEEGREREGRARREFEVLMGVAGRVRDEGWRDRLVGAMAEDLGAEAGE